MSKKAVFLILICVSIICFSSCTPNENVPAGTESTADSSLSVSDTSAPPKIDKKDYKRVCFIGNSLTNAGDVPNLFYTVCRQNKKPFYVMSKLGGGYTLQKHLDEYKSGGFDDQLRLADIVVFQEYGTQDVGTLQAVKELMPLFKKDVKFYVYLTEFDYNNRPQELRELDNITYIPSGYITLEKFNDIFTYEQLHLPGDYHPNNICAYITMLSIYSVITGESCIGIDYKFLEYETEQLIPGSTEQEKADNIKTIQERVMQGLKDYTEVYPNT